MRKTFFIALLIALSTVEGQNLDSLYNVFVNAINYSSNETLSFSSIIS